MADGIHDTAWIFPTAGAVTGATGDLLEPWVTRVTGTLDHAAGTLAGAAAGDGGGALAAGFHEAAWIGATAGAVTGATGDLLEPWITRVAGTLDHAAGTLAGAAAGDGGGALAAGFHEAAWIGATAGAVTGATGDLLEPWITRVAGTLDHAAGTLAGAAAGSRGRGRGGVGLAVTNRVRDTAWIEATASAVAGATGDLVEPRVTRRELLRYAAGALAGATAVDPRVGRQRRQGTETEHRHPNEKAGERAKRG